MQEPPKIKPSNSAITGRPNSTTNHQPMPNRQRNTRANSAPTPARPSVIEVTHRAVGSMISSVDASAKISTGRLAPGITPWKARTGIDNSSQLRPSTITRNPARGRRATHLSTPSIGGLHVETERDKAEAARCLATT
jgi:hypothetical protein